MTEIDSISLLIRKPISPHVGSYCNENDEIILPVGEIIETMRVCSFVCGWFCSNTLRAFDATPQMKLKPSLRMNQMEYLNKKMCSAFAFSKMNKAEVGLALSYY